MWRAAAAACAYTYRGTAHSCSHRHAVVTQRRSRLIDAGMGALQVRRMHALNMIPASPRIHAMCIICVVCDAGNRCVCKSISNQSIALAGISSKHAGMQAHSCFGSVLTGTAAVSRLAGAATSCYLCCRAASSERRSKGPSPTGLVE
jgi:hypothetical protein